MKAFSVGRGRFVARRSNSFHIETEENEVFLRYTPHKGSKGKGPTTDTGVARI
jgi:hypothetical protein